MDDNERDELFLNIMADTNGIVGDADRSAAMQRALRHIARSRERPTEPLREDQPDIMQPNKTKRHLTKTERDKRHKPAPDYVESKRGEKCVSHSALEVRDLVGKFYQAQVIP